MATGVDETVLGTRATLAGDGSDALAKAVPKAAPAVIKTALGQRGVHESGNNRGVPLQRYVNFFAPKSPPVPWCAYFVSWSIAKSTNKQTVPWTNPGYVGSIRDWAAKSGNVVRTPRPGDIFGIGTEHVGLVVGANRAARTIATVEGNYQNKVSQRTLNYQDPRIWFARPPAPPRVRVRP